MVYSPISDETTPRQAVCLASSSNILLLNLLWEVTQSMTYFRILAHLIFLFFPCYLERKVNMWQNSQTRHSMKQQSDYSFSIRSKREVYRCLRRIQRRKMILSRTSPNKVNSLNDVIPNSENRSDALPASTSSCMVSQSPFHRNTCLKTSISLYSFEYRFFSYAFFKRRIFTTLQQSLTYLSHLAVLVRLSLTFSPSNFCLWRISLNTEDPPSLVQDLEVSQVWVDDSYSGASSSMFSVQQLVVLGMWHDVMEGMTYF